MKKIAVASVLLALAIAGCGTAPPVASDRQPVPAPLPSPPPRASEPAPPPPGAPSAPQAQPPMQPPAPRQESTAIAGLMQSARADAAAGRLANAAASIERALRIEPRNPRLWSELARVRYQQRDYTQAESTAARSNAFAGADNALRAINWQLIAQAREARGDAAGARAAQDMLRKLR